MEGLGIFSGADLAAKDPVWLATHFGNSAEWLFNLARGIDHRRVKSNRPLKSLGGERTFFNDLITDTEIRGAGACLRSEEHPSELQSLMRISYAVFCLKKKKFTHT